MNLNNFGATIEENETGENENIGMFMNSFKRKLRFRDSLFENSFVQKINSQNLINMKDHSPSKYMEFNLSSADFLSDLQSITAHIKCKIMEKKADKTLGNLGSNILVGTIPSSIISNCIKNFRLFIFDTQISAERSDRYSLISYISHYFNGQLTDPKHCCFDDGLYFDQSSSNYLLTSKGEECSEALLKAEAISQGFHDNASFFKSSATHTFCEKLQSPFLFSLPNLLLPKVKWKTSF